MNNSIKEFIYYLNEVGAINNIDLFIESFLNKHGHDEKEVDINTLIQFLVEYIKKGLENMYNENKNQQYSPLFSIERIYNCFIEKDDKEILKIIRRLLTIKTKFDRKVKQSFFLKWYFESKLLFQKENKTKSRSKSKTRRKQIVSFGNVKSKSPSEFKDKIQYDTKDTKDTKFNQSYNKMNLYDVNYNHDYDYNHDYNHDYDSNYTYKPIENPSNNIKNTSNNNTQKTNHDLNNNNNTSNIEKHPQNDIFNRLYNDNQVRRSKQIEIVKHITSKDLEQCTFRPLLNQTTEAIMKTKKERKNVPIYDHLINFNDIKQDKINKMITVSQDNLNEKYPFRPEIEKTKKINSLLVNETFDQRVIKYNNQKAYNLEKIRKDIEKESEFEMRNMRKTSLPLRSKSLELVSNYSKYKEQRLNILKSNIDNECGITFKPKINNNIPVYDDFIKRNHDHLLRKDEKIRQLKVYEDQECTFIPKTNTKKDLTNSNEQAYDRLLKYQLIYDNKKEIKKKENTIEYTFTPMINKNTNTLLLNRRLENKENPYENIDNFYNNHIQSQCFKPITEAKEINENSSYYKKEGEMNINSSHERIYNLYNESITSHSNNMNKTEKLSIVPLSSDNEFDYNQNKNSKSKEIDYNQSKISHNEILERKELIKYLQRKNKTIPNTISNTQKKGLFILDSLSDEQLLELANLYITTDESLERFQSKIFYNLNPSIEYKKVENIKTKLKSKEKDKDKDKEAEKGRKDRLQREAVTLNKELRYIDNRNENRNSNNMNNTSPIKNSILMSIAKKSSSSLTVSSNSKAKNDKTLLPVQIKNENIQKAIKYYNNINPV